jgi:hypothetical protein
MFTLRTGFVSQFNYKHFKFSHMLLLSTKLCVLYTKYKSDKVQGRQKKKKERTRDNTRINKEMTKQTVCQFEPNSSNLTFVYKNKDRKWMKEKL